MLSPIFVLDYGTRMRLFGVATIGLVHLALMSFACAPPRTPCMAPDVISRKTDSNHNMQLFHQDLRSRLLLRTDVDSGPDFTIVTHHPHLGVLVFQVDTRKEETLLRIVEEELSCPGTHSPQLRERTFSVDPHNVQALADCLQRANFTTLQENYLGSSELQSMDGTAIFMQQTNASGRHVVSIEAGGETAATNLAVRCFRDAEEAFGYQRPAWPSVN